MNFEYLTLQNVGIALGVVFLIYFFLRKEGDFVKDMMNFAFAVILPVVLMYLLVKFMA